ncbi:MAG: phosphate acetyltransferase [Candidatus Hydrogenedentes bacterium]|nr:phosphate acetyltransferase [Candidatus Hydrogenedentota bacterium]
MGLVEDIITQAKGSPRRILLPEAEDERTLRAAHAAEAEGIAHVILVGDAAKVQEKLKALDIRTQFEIVDPATSASGPEFVQAYFEMRKAKGLTLDEAGKLMRDPIYFAIMMLNRGMADGMVAGACHSTAYTLRPALQIIKTSPDASLVSSFFFMTCGDTTYLFADSGLVEDPDAKQLSEIAVETAKTAVAFGIPPVVAMLSYSTKGSAHSPLTEKVVEATKLAVEAVRSRFGEDSPIRIDGELQGDAALSERVAASKAPGSPVAGKARVLVFPDLNAGNIAYKLVQWLGGASAYGPILQGLRLPVNDLSRGCTWEDIKGVVAVTVVQSQRLTPAEVSAPVAAV